MWHVYILQCRDGTYYTGVTTDLPKRIQRHNDGKGARYTRSRRPVKVVYTEDLENRSLAAKREIEIQGFTREDKLKLIGLK